MPSVSGRIWTKSRQVAGNLIPGLLSFPLAGAGLVLWNADDPLRPLPLALLGLFPFWGWLCLNFFGLASNRVMADALGQRYGREYGRPDAEREFVGYASPSFRSVWDPHEDVAWLFLHPDQLELYGDQIRANLLRRDVLQVRLRPNVHSWLGLGGWIEVIGRGQTWRIEPRRYSTLLGNRRYRKQLYARLVAWHLGVTEKSEPPRKKT